MQDKNLTSAKKILLALADYTKVKGIRGLAAFLGVPDSTLYAWAKRGNVADVGLILAKLPEIRPEWLEAGEGPMLRGGTTYKAAAPFQATSHMTAEPTVHRGIEGAIIDWLEQEIFPDPAETLALVGLLQREYACFRRRTEKRDGGDCELKRLA